MSERSAFSSFNSIAEKARQLSNGGNRSKGANYNKVDALKRLYTSPDKKYSDVAKEQSIDLDQISAFVKPPAHNYADSPIYSYDYVLAAYNSYGYSDINAISLDYTFISSLLTPSLGYVLDGYIDREF